MGTLLQQAVGLGLNVTLGPRGHAKKEGKKSDCLPGSGKWRPDAVPPMADAHRHTCWHPRYTLTIKHKHLLTHSYTLHAYTLCLHAQLHTCLNAYICLYTCTLHAMPACYTLCLHAQLYTCLNAYPCLYTFTLHAMLARYMLTCRRQNIFLLETMPCVFV